MDADALGETRELEEIVHAVLVAEGLDPSNVRPKARSAIAQAVNDWLFDPAGRGARSVLPR
jgi:hypothetical protein